MPPLRMKPPGFLSWDAVERTFKASKPTETTFQQIGLGRGQESEHRRLQGQLKNGKRAVQRAVQISYKQHSTRKSNLPNQAPTKSGRKQSVNKYMCMRGKYTHTKIGSLRWRKREIYTGQGAGSTNKIVRIYFLKKESRRIQAIYTEICWQIPNEWTLSQRGQDSLTAILGVPYVCMYIKKQKI